MKPYLILLAFLLASFTSFAQKNAPVAGDAATLADLLKKDYSALDPDLSGDELVKDRAQVISILRSFLDTTKYKGYPNIYSDSLNRSMLKASTETGIYLNAKRAYSATSITSVSTSDANVINAVNKAAANKESLYDTSRASYYSARYLADHQQLNLLHYEFGQDTDTFVQDVITMFSQKYLEIDSARTDEYATVNPNGTVNKALPVIGAFGSTTEIIDGLSKFIAKRIKEELTTFAVQNIQTWLNAHNKTTPTEELLVLFPSTAAYIMKFDADKVTSFPNEIKQYIESDLNHLMDNGYNLRNTTLFQKLIQQYPDLGLAFEGFHLVPQLTKLKNPADFISVLNSSSFMALMRARKDTTSAQMVASLSFLELISNSLTVNTNGETQYTTVDFWNTYGREYPFMELYLGFLYQQNDKYFRIDFPLHSKHLNLHKGLIGVMHPSKLHDPVAALQPVFADICKNAETIYDQAQNLRKLNNGGQKLGADTIFSFNKSVIDFAGDLGKDADSIIAVFTTDASLRPNITKKIQPYIMIADTANDALKNIFDKKYAAGILELLETAYAIIPNGQLGQAIGYSKFYSLSKLQSPSWTAWTGVSALYASPGTVSPLQAAGIVTVKQEIINVRTFYSVQHGKSADVINVVNKAIALLQAATTGAKLDATAISNFNKIWQDPDFQGVVVSYYANFLVPDGFGAISADMATPHDDGTGNLAPALDKKSVKAFTKNFDQYISLVFTTDIVKTTNTAGTLSDLEGTLQSSISAYVGSQSSVFGYKLDDRVVSLIHFINDMALAKKSDDVEQAIEALALPAGSYSIKQKSFYTITLNSFPGIIGGLEQTTGKKLAGSIGFTAPVGFNITWGHVFCKTWTLGAFIPLIDIGAVTRLRLDQDNDTQSLPALDWNNFFSPGAYLTVGIGKTPFSFNIGAQYGPELRTLTAAPTSSTWLFGAAITIDIPLFNIYNRPFGN